VIRAVQPGPVVGLIGQLAVLSVIATTVGLGVGGWLAGTACGLVTAALLIHGLTRSGIGVLGAANRVTLVRATVVGGVTALVAEALVGPASVAAIAGLSVLALVLDGVDGWVARRTGTVSALGARFDMEIDAFLILVLSMYVAQSVGPWVLAIGAARYAVWAVGWVLRWMRTPLPPRYWRKPVAAIQGIVLTAAVADLLPGVVINVAIVVAMALLTESFGWDVAWQWRRHRFLRSEDPLRASSIARRRGEEEEPRRSSSASDDEQGGFPARCASSEILAESVATSPSPV
jgi:phosphatidylglycerophosphate synthase